MCKIRVVLQLQLIYAVLQFSTPYILAFTSGKNTILSGECQGNVRDFYYLDCVATLDRDMGTRAAASPPHCCLVDCFGSFRNSRPPRPRPPRQTHARRYFGAAGMQSDSPTLLPAGTTSAAAPAAYALDFPWMCIQGVDSIGAAPPGGGNTARWSRRRSSVSLLSRSAGCCHPGRGA